MTRTEQIVDFVIHRHIQPPLYSPQILAQRQALRAEIEQDKARLELLRVKETGLRAELVRELSHLAANAKRAEFKIETRQWEDGNPALDIDIERMQEAAEALADCIDDIAHTLLMIEDQQHDLDDLQLWKEENDNA